MIWNRLPVYAGIVLGFCLIARLLSLRLHTVYRLFCAFLIFELVASSVMVANAALHDPWDYRVLWLAFTVPQWALTFWTVYALLDAILKELPGVLSFSRRLLNVVFITAAVLGGLSAKLEWDSGRIARAVDWLSKSVVVGIAVERVVGTVVVAVLLAILTFVLWFPVKMPRNLVLFSIGLVFYYALRTGLLLARSFLPHRSENLLSAVSLVVLPACYVYWALGITKAGERTPVRIGHGWSVEVQHSLVQQLENMNTALLRNSQS